jgi:hypothetical protein
LIDNANKDQELREWLRILGVYVCKVSHLLVYIVLEKL